MIELKIDGVTIPDLNTRSIYYLDKNYEMHIGCISEYRVSEHGVIFRYVNFESKWDMYFSNEDIGHTIFFRLEDIVSMRSRRLKNRKQTTYMERESDCKFRGFTKEESDKYYKALEKIYANIGININDILDYKIHK